MESDSEAICVAAEVVYQLARGHCPREVAEIMDLNDRALAKYACEVSGVRNRRGAFDPIFLALQVAESALIGIAVGEDRHDISESAGMDVTRKREMLKLSRILWREYDALTRH